MRIRAALAIAVAMPALAQAPPAAASKQRSDRLERIAKAEINGMRAQARLPALKQSRTLTRSASNYAAYMLRRSYFGHLSTIRASRRYRSLGEIILMHRGGHGRPRVAVKYWGRSSAHRAIMLSGKYGLVGVGKSSGWYDGHRVTMWVAHVGRRWALQREH